MKYLLVVLGFLFISLPSNAQQKPTVESKYEISRVDPPLSITKEELLSALTIEDLNRFYKDSWVKKYTSVELRTIQNGKSVKTNGNAHSLTAEQIQNLQKADEGSEVEFVIQYWPENSLKENELKKFDFKFLVNPSKEAQFPGGQKKLDAYFAANGMEHIYEQILEKNKLTIIQFSIDENGSVLNPTISEASNNTELDKSLMDFICKMPKWNPAQYDTGRKTTQDFVLTIGDHRSCMYNLITLNI